MKIHSGGLFRCCIEAVKDHVLHEETASDGDVVECPHCHEEIEYNDYVWKWRQHGGPGIV